MHADVRDTQDRKLIVTAGSEKAKWKQLLTKGWKEKAGGGLDGGPGYRRGCQLLYTE